MFEEVIKYLIDNLEVDITTSDNNRITVKLKLCDNVISSSTHVI